MAVGESIAKREERSVGGVQVCGAVVRIVFDRVLGTSRIQLVIKYRDLSDADGNTHRKPAGEVFLTGEYIHDAMSALCAGEPRHYDALAETAYFLQIQRPAAEHYGDDILVYFIDGAQQIQLVVRERNVGAAGSFSADAAVFSEENVPDDPYDHHRPSAFPVYP